MSISQAFGPGRVARGVAIETVFQPLSPSGARFRPVHIGVVGVAADSATVDYTTPKDILSLSDALVFGRKSPIYQACSMLKPQNAKGVGDIPVTVYPVEVTGGSAAPAAGSIGASAGFPAIADGSVVLRAGDFESGVITIETGDSLANFITKAIAACAEKIDFPLLATDGTTVVTLTAGWSGATGNEVVVAVDTIIDAGITWTITQPTGGAGDVDIDDALSLIKSTWISHIVNCEERSTANYNKYSNFNELRWSPTVYKPFKVYHGNTTLSVATVAAISDARKSDRTNTIKPVPGSANFAWEIAARCVQAQSVIANVDAARDYGSQQLTLLDDGGEHNSWSEQDGEYQYAVIRGCSTSKFRSGILRIADSIMMYHPDGEDPPAYRYDVDIEKISAMIYNIDLIFNNETVDGAPLVPDGQVTTNPNARKPSYFKGKLFDLYDAMARAAIISDPDYAKDNTIVQISGTNPKRLDVLAVYKLSGNANVFSITQKFSFFFGGE